MGVMSVERDRSCFSWKWSLVEGIVPPDLQNGVVGNTLLKHLKWCMIAAKYSVDCLVLTAV